MLDSAQQRFVSRIERELRRRHLRDLERCAGCGNMVARDEDYVWLPGGVMHTQCAERATADPSQ